MILKQRKERLQCRHQLGVMQFYQLTGLMHTTLSSSAPRFQLVKAKDGNSTPCSRNSTSRIPVRSNSMLTNMASACEKQEVPQWCLRPGASVRTPAVAWLSSVERARPSLLIPTHVLQISFRADLLSAVPLTTRTFQPGLNGRLN